MPLATTEKQQIMSDMVKKMGLAEKSTGSSAVQIALLTAKITQLTTHLKQFRKDMHSQRGLLKMVSRRRRLLNYLARTNANQYRQVLAELGLRN